MDYAIKIVEQSGRELTDYQIRIEITDEEFFNKCTDQRYIEFYDEDKQTLLSHYTELFDTANKIAIFWVKVPSIPANGTKYIYLNINTERTEDLSDPLKVFDFFDDFEGDDLNTDIWEVVGSGGYSVADGQLTLWANNNENNEYARIKTQTFSDIAVKTKAKLMSYSDEDYRAFGIVIRGTTDWNSTRRVGYHGYATDRDDEIVIYLVTESTGTTLTSSAKTISKDTFYEMEFCASGNKLKFKCNGDVITAEDSTYDSGYVSIFICEGKAVFEYIIIRKYTDPEPSVTVIRLGATPTYDLKLKIAQALAGETTTILDTDPKIRLLSGTDIIKELSLTAKTVYKDATNNRVVVAFLFVDDSSDEYTADNLELLFTKDNTEYIAFKSSKSFTKVADKRLPLRWEIYLNYDVDVCTYEESMVTCL